jgi:protein subunit release factor A
MTQATQYIERVEIELLKKDVNNISMLCEKFDKTIDKMQEIASNLSKMASLQEQRLSSQEETTKDFQSRLEMRRAESNMEIKELHSRITTVNRELTDKIECSERTIMNELRLIRNEMSKDLVEDTGGMKNRLAKIENWQYTVVGGIIVITWILAKIDLEKFVKLIF